MMKYEFEKLALRNDATISQELYDSIERFYVSDNDYHRTHGGIDETKMDFVKRVFGGKVNTPRSIARKIAEESCRENRWVLQGNDSITEKHLKDMDGRIKEHYEYLLKYFD